MHNVVLHERCSNQIHRPILQPIFHIATNKFIFEIRNNNEK